MDDNRVSSNRGLFFYNNDSGFDKKDNKNKKNIDFFNSKIQGQQGYEKKVDVKFNVIDQSYEYSNKDVLENIRYETFNSKKMKIEDYKIEVIHQFFEIDDLKILKYIGDLLVEHGLDQEFNNFAPIKKIDIETAVNNFHEKARLLKEEILSIKSNFYDSLKGGDIVLALKELEEKQKQFNSFFLVRNSEGILKGFSEHDNLNGTLFDDFFKMDSEISDAKKTLMMQLIQNEIANEKINWNSIDKLYYMKSALSLDIPMIDKNKIEELKEMVTYGIDMYLDGFNLNFIQQLIEARLELRRSNVIEKLPLKMEFQDIKKGTMCGKNQEEEEINDPLSCVGFRGEDSVSVRLWQHIIKQGGDPEFVKVWGSHQANGTWSDTPLIIKNWILSKQDAFYLNQIMESNREEKEKKEICNEFIEKKMYTRLGVLTKDDNIEKLKEEFFGEEGFKKEKAFTIWLAMQMEVLTRVDIPGSNREKRTIMLYRSEHEAVEEISKDSEKGDLLYMKRSPLESSSIGEPIRAVYVIPTIQEVPFHHILGMYFFENDGGWSFFPGFEPQKEFVFMPNKVFFKRL